MSENPTWKTVNPIYNYPILQFNFKCDNSQMEDESSIEEKSISIPNYIQYIYEFNEKTKTLQIYDQQGKHLWKFRFVDQNEFHAVKLLVFDQEN